MSDMASDPSGSPAAGGCAPRLGRLVPPYPTDHCANVDCERPLEIADDGAYMFKSHDSGKLVVFCEDCAMDVELNHRTRFSLVAL